MEKTSTRVVAIVPARGGSQRIPRKNIKLLCGAPLISWAINAAQNCEFVSDGEVYVSTDDAEIADVAKFYNAKIINRPTSLSGPDVWTEPVIQNAVEQIEETGAMVDFIVWQNACVPQLTAADIDEAGKLILAQNLREVIAVNSFGVSNSAVRILKREALFQSRLSVNFGVILFPYIDINILAEFDEVERIMSRNGCAFESQSD